MTQVVADHELVFAHLGQHGPHRVPERSAPGPSYPIHSITSEQLARLVAQTGEELVGLCYFGDQQSRERIEAQLAAVPPLFFIGSDARPRALPAAIAFAAQSGSGFTESNTRPAGQTTGVGTANIL
jgi:hypothetical protein